VYDRDASRETDSGRPVERTTATLNRRGGFQRLTMGVEEIYADLETDVSEEEFREAVEAKVEQMGGLADEESAAMLVAHELGGGEVETVADVQPGQDEVKFTAKVLSIGEVRTFERDGEDSEDGHVVNVEVADETGSVRVALWDEAAVAAEEELEVGQVLKIAGRPKDGYSGVEVNADRVETDEDTEIDVDPDGEATVESLSLGQGDVNLRGRVLDTESVRTFDRDDGTEGRVANLALGDPTGRVRVTLWDEMADRVEELAPGTSVEVVDGYVRERDGQLELHVGSRSAVEETAEDVEYVPDATPIAEIEIGQTVDIAGVVRSADPKRTFDRDDGSEGQVRNVRVQDRSADIRVALWGDKADRELGPGDEVLLADVEIQDGWQDDLEASANWRSTVSLLEDGATAAPEVDVADDSGGGADGPADEPQSGGLDAFTGDDADVGSSSAPEPTSDSDDATASDDAEGEIEFTGVVVQAGDPVLLDDGEETMTVRTGEDVHLGQEVRVRGPVQDGTLDAEEFHPV
jgi:replication factor A1